MSAHRNRRFSVLPTALLLASAAACSDGALLPSRSPDDPSNPLAAEAPATNVAAPSSPPPAAASGAVDPHAHHHHPGMDMSDAGAR